MPKAHEPTRPWHANYQGLKTLTKRFKKENMNLWNQLENRTLKERTQIEQHLIKKLGSPQTEIQHNLLSELTKKINSYYAEESEQNYTTYSLMGFISEIQERQYKEGKRKGQIYYVLKLGGGSSKEILQARQEDLPKEKWTQIEKLAILGRNLVFKYKKWITNKQVLDFYPPAKK